MADKADIYAKAFGQGRQAEDEVCERTLKRLREHAEVMGISLEEALQDVIPESRGLLTEYMTRKANTPRA